MTNRPIYGSNPVPPADPDDDATMTTEAGAIAALAFMAGEALKLEPGNLYVIHNGHGGLAEFDLTGDQWRDHPRRIQQTVHLRHYESLLDYWRKYADPSSEMWADDTGHTLTAILDAHHADVAIGSPTAEEAQQARWQQHRAVLKLRLSDPLTAWLAKNQKLLTQEQFGEFLEDRMPDIASPPGADLMEMVRGLEINQRATFKSGVLLKSGARRLNYEETIDGRTSDREVDIPDQLVLRLPIWAGDTTAHQVTARFRFRANQPRPGEVSLYYKLDGIQQLIDAAFTGIVADLAAELGRPIYHGTPAA